jgi:hypothetical protein
MEKNREPAKCDECGLERKGARYRIFKPGVKKALWICEKCFDVLLDDEAFDVQ